MSLFTELKRRNVLRVAAAYVAVSWLLIQVVETLFPVFGLSDAAIRAVVIVLAVGFVPVVVVAWAFELTPDGFVRDSDVDRDSLSARASTKRLDRIVMVALALAVGYFAFDKFMLDPARDAALAESAREQGRIEATQAKRNTGPPVLAVLPFSAVTSTEDSEFFAAGVHDDLLTKLAQLPSMLVISRTSVLEYKDTKVNIRDIGAALGADAILEGGVQTAGDRIRINAQLIDAKTDEHLWAETYDRELTAASIFDVQDDIAHAIAEALQVTLAGSSEKSLIPTTSMAAYRAYHEAITIRDASHGGITSDEYRQLLRKSFELDPAFTRPRSLLVGSYALEAFGSNEPGLVTKAEATLEEIRAIAPNSADFLIAQTYYTYYILRDYDLALQIAEKALRLAPSDTNLVQVISWIKRRQGDFEGHLEAARLARQLDPADENLTGMFITVLMRMHRYDEARTELDAREELDYRMHVLRAQLAVEEHGDFDRLAADVQLLADEYDDKFEAYDLWFTRLLARDFEGAVDALGALPDPTGPPGLGLSNRQAVSILAYWASGDDAKLAQLVAEGRETLEQLGSADELRDENAILSYALLAALDGDTAESRKLVRDWYRGGAQDLAGRTLNWDIACQVLGISGAADEAAQCIREGLEAPSHIMPFVEPYLPFYDPIRDEPVFVELVEELQR